VVASFFVQSGHNEFCICGIVPLGVAMVTRVNIHCTLQAYTVSVMIYTGLQLCSLNNVTELGCACALNIEYAIRAIRRVHVKSILNHQNLETSVRKCAYLSHETTHCIKFYIKDNQTIV